MFCFYTFRRKQEAIFLIFCKNFSNRPAFVHIVTNCKLRGKVDDFFSFKKFFGEVVTQFIFDHFIFERLQFCL